MILLTCQLYFEGGTGERILNSIVYDDATDRFVKISQKISPELVQDLSSPNPMVDIMEVISLDYADYEFNDDELEDIFEMVEDGPENEIVIKAREFVKSYRRNKKIKNIINEKD